MGVSVVERGMGEYGGGCGRREWTGVVAVVVGVWGVLGGRRRNEWVIRGVIFPYFLPML